jgi:hypothetical protein
MVVMRGNSQGRVDWREWKDDGGQGGLGSGVGEMSAEEDEVILDGVDEGVRAEAGCGVVGEEELGRLAGEAWDGQQLALDREAGVERHAVLRAGKEGGDVGRGDGAETEDVQNGGGMEAGQVLHVGEQVGAAGFVVGVGGLGRRVAAGHVRDVGTGAKVEGGATDVGLGNDFSGLADEGDALLVLVEAWVLADQQERGVLGPARQGVREVMQRNADGAGFAVELAGGAGGTGRELDQGNGILVMREHVNSINSATTDGRGALSRCRGSSGSRHLRGRELR